MTGGECVLRSSRLAFCSTRFVGGVCKVSASVSVLGQTWLNNISNCLCLGAVHLYVLWVEQKLWKPVLFHTLKLTIDSLTSGNDRCWFLLNSIKCVTCIFIWHQLLYLNFWLCFFPAPLQPTNYTSTKRKFRIPFNTAAKQSYRNCI